MAMTPKPVRQAGRRKAMRFLSCGRGNRFARREFPHHRRCPAALARMLAKPHSGFKPIIPYEDLPEAEPITGALRAEIVFEDDPYFGKAFKVGATLLVDPPIPLRGVWSLEVRDGATRREAEAMAKAIEAGVIVTGMEAATDVYGVRYVYFDTAEWANRKEGESLVAWIGRIRKGPIEAK
jgi:hypothetical protein